MGPVKDMAIYWCTMLQRLVNSRPQPRDPQPSVAMNACQAHTSIRVQLDVHQWGNNGQVVVKVPPLNGRSFATSSDAKHNLREVSSTVPTNTKKRISSSKGPFNGMSSKVSDEWPTCYSHLCYYHRVPGDWRPQFNMQWPQISIVLFLYPAWTNFSLTLQSFVKIKHHQWVNTAHFPIQFVGI